MDHRSEHEARPSVAMRPIDLPHVIRGLRNSATRRRGGPENKHQYAVRY
jgi:hypothetical protein